MIFSEEKMAPAPKIDTSFEDSGRINLLELRANKRIFFGGLAKDPRPQTQSNFPQKPNPKAVRTRNMKREADA